MKPRLFVIVFAALLALVGGTARAELVLDQNYELVLPAQPAESKGRIEVVELFWYGCPHCYALEPVLAQWSAAQPKDVVFRRLHADFGRWTQSARLFNALEAIGEEARLRKDLFDAIHLEHLQYTKETDVADWLAQKGVAREKFLAAYHAAAVQEKTKQAALLTQAYGIDGVPGIVVAGKYRTSSAMVGGHESLPAILDALIAKARSEAAKN